MAFSVAQNTKYSVKQETTEGVYEAPSAGSDFITVLADGAEMNGTKESLERNILGVGLTKPQPRTANRAVSGTLPCEFKAGSNEGDKPEYSELIQAAMGSEREVATNTTSKAGNGTNTVEIEDADISKFEVGDMIVVKEAGAYHVSPITAVDSTGGAANITLLTTAASAFSDNVEISKYTTYKTADSGHPTFSVTKYIEDNVETQGIGCRVTTMSLENFVANQLASWNFAFEGLDFKTSINPIGVVPEYDSSLPPIIVEACVYKDGVRIPVSELSISVENTVGTITSTCAKSGKISSRISERTVTGSMSPYIQSDDVVIQGEFDNDTLYSIFFYAYNPTSTDGEFNQVVAGYMPSCSTTELTEGDLDGVLQHSVSFSASGGTAGSGTQLFLGYI
jgi:hypothetical protein